MMDEIRTRLARRPFIHRTLVRTYHDGFHMIDMGARVLGSEAETLLILWREFDMMVAAGAVPFRRYRQESPKC